MPHLTTHCSGWSGNNQKLIRNYVLLYKFSPTPSPEIGIMCQQVTTYRRCRTCKQDKNSIVRNINCGQVSIYKLGQCSNGIIYRDVEEVIECSGCQTRREQEVEADRKRRFVAAWPEPEKESENEEQNEQKSERSDGDGISVGGDLTENSEDSWKMV
ncbi:hypothetical protein FBEOM_6432 [Fusarium beomiforme]|uniref:Uncharacterized protein n=1 Tax=Fusarium beomiforme TaxID=44412 RepID=A0A9P5AJI6_9HYPO|nr:hypothetical protein FBEOM_6432 [Fusarium beomiforme]